MGAPLPPNLNIRTSEIMEIAISSGVLALISSPMGERISLIRSMVSSDRIRSSYIKMVFLLLPIKPTYRASVFAAANRAELSYRCPLVATTMNVFLFIGSLGRASSGFSEIIMSASGNLSELANSSLSSVMKSLNSSGFAKEAIALETCPPPHMTN